MGKTIDIAGQRFGNLYVLRKSNTKPYAKDRSVVWECLCDCGNNIEVSSAYLRRGQTTHCGCKTRDRRLAPIGQRHGQLEITNYIGLDKWKHSVYECLCDCGNITYQILGSLTSGHTTSCGCTRYEKIAEASTVHGLSYTPEYNAMVKRKRRHREYELDFNWTHDMEEAIRKFFPACVICGITEEKHLQTIGSHLEVDHVNPLSRGHGLEPGNAVRLCKKCNQEKSGKPLHKITKQKRELLESGARDFQKYWENYYELR